MLKAVIDSEQVTLEKLRNSILGRDNNLSPSKAMAAILKSNFPNKPRELERVLLDEEAPSNNRYMAAIYLSKISEPASLDILKSAGNIQNEKVLSGVATALGRVGDSSALELLNRFQERFHGLAASRSRFAAALISHRLGLRGNELPLPDEQDYLTVDNRSVQQLQILEANETDAELCLRSIADENIGIEFSKSSVYQGRLSNCTWMILFNRDFSQEEAVKQLIRRKALLGVVVTQIGSEEEQKVYSIAYLLLTSPNENADAFNILLHRPKGELAFAGMAKLEDDSAQFSIRTVSRPGAIPIQIKGKFKGEKLEISEAISGSSALEKRHPTPIK
jgi:hypothetical protein